MLTSVTRLSRCGAPASRNSATFLIRRRLAAPQTSLLSGIVPASACLASSSSSSSLFSGALVCSTRSFYDKIREKRDGSDEGPDQMFEDFAKSPHRERVPVELHKGNKDAVETAEHFNQIFFVFLIFFMIGVIYYVDPFNRDQYDRPEGYGVTEPTTNVFGSSDRA
ncbi:hypothetical protein N2W54_003004 [Lotmaria passim]